MLIDLSNYAKKELLTDKDVLDGLRLNEMCSAAKNSISETHHSRRLDIFSETISLGGNILKTFKLNATIYFNDRFCYNLERYYFSFHQTLICYPLTSGHQLSLVILLM